MKRKSILLVVSVLLCLILVGCGEQSSNSVNESSVPEIASNQTGEASESNELAGADESAGQSNVPDSNSTAELKAPIIESCELYNPNGFDTLTAIISNPNDIAIDVAYDIVFYKGGSEVSRIEGCFNESIMPGAKDVVWANYDVPSSQDADDVKMENVQVFETSYPPINGTYEFEGEKDGEAFYHFEFESQPTIATISFLLYDDKNSNDKYDEGEIIVVCIESLLEQQGSLSYDTGYAANEKCEVFVKAN